MDILIAFLLLGGELFFHETGHYLMAYKYGWKPKLGFEIKGLFTGFYVQPTKIHDINEVADVLNYSIKQVTIASGGLFGALPIMLWGLLSGEYQNSFIISLFLSYYVIYEMVSTLQGTKIYPPEEDKSDEAQ